MINKSRRATKADDSVANLTILRPSVAEVAELADAADSKSAAFTGVSVRLRSSAPHLSGARHRAGPRPSMKRDADAR
jgi:hypothetical protein